MNFIYLFFKKLLHAFGPQGWWPTTPSHSTHPVYVPKRSFRKLTENERLEICLGAILTQNTSWKNVERVLIQLKREGRLNFATLFRVSRPRLEKSIRSSGFFRQKAKRLIIFMEQVKKETNGNLKQFLSGPLNRVREKLLHLNGIGPETADSMLLYASGHPIFVVDAYTRRIANRWGVLRGKEGYETIQKIFMDHLPCSPSHFGEMHALLVKLGKEVCQKKPLCKFCVLRVHCQTGKRSFK